MLTASSFKAASILAPAALAAAATFEVGPNLGTVLTAVINAAAAGFIGHKLGTKRLAGRGRKPRRPRVPKAVEKHKHGTN